MLSDGRELLNLPIAVCGNCYSTCVKIERLLKAVFLSESPPTEPPAEVVVRVVSDDTRSVTEAEVSQAVLTHNTAGGVEKRTQNSASGVMSLLSSITLPELVTT